MAVPLRIPSDVKKRIARLAARRDTTSHEFMLNAICQKVEDEETTLSFYEQAKRRLARMKKPGLAIPASEVFDYLHTYVHMNQTIVKAIEKRQRLRLTYNGKVRIVEPQCYGIGTKGTELLRVHQIRGGSQREPLFDVAKIKDLVVLDEFFKEPGPNYKKNDSAIKKIFCQL